MADTISLQQQIRDIASHIGVILSAQDVDILTHEERALLATIKRQVADARLDVRDYDYADTRAEQLRHATAGKKNLDTVLKNILKASEYNMFGPVDIAQLSAQIEDVKEKLA